MTKKYISDVISNKEMQKWGKGDSIIIESGTGTGKSTFILNKLHEHALENNETILLLVPRKLIKLQFEEDLVKNFNGDTSIKVETYQWLETNIQNATTLEQFDYIVSDEAHYFLRDSDFNSTTRNSFMYILNSNSKKIFLSATMKRFRDILKFMGIKKCHHYTVEKNYDYIKNINLFQHTHNEKVNYIEKELYKIIEQKEKAIVFINNIKELKEMYSKFKKYSTIIYRGNIDTLGTDENSKEIQTVLTEGIVPKQIVFTTSILEMGVTFKDRDLKHIFTDGFSIENIIQMVGRKREFDLEDTLTLHIRKYTQQQIAGFKSSYVNRFACMNNILKNGIVSILENQGEKAFREIVSSTDVYPSIKNGSIEYQINPLTYVNISYWLGILTKLQKDDETKFEDLLRAVFRTSEISNNSKEKYDLNVNLVLELFLGRKLYTKRQRTELINKLDLKGSNRKVLRTHKTINARLKELGINFKIASKRDRRRKVVNKSGKRINNPNRDRTYWEIIKVTTPPKLPK